MSEFLPASPERKAESQENNVEQREKLEKTLEAGREAEHQLAKKETLESIQESIKNEAVSGKEYSVGEREKSADSSPVTINKQVKKAAYKKTLKHVQRQLSPPERILSNVIHQPTIDTISNIGARTVARPSGVLGGGIVSLLGTGALLFISKHFGFNYNFFVFILLFVLGYGLGVLLELVIRGVRPAKRKATHKSAS